MAFSVVARTRGLRDLGNQQSPFDAWVTLQKLESLPLRMEKHCENAMAVAEYLEDHDEVAWVNYPASRATRPTRQASTSRAATAA